MKYSKVLILLCVGSIVGFLFLFGVDLQRVNLAKMKNVDVNMIPSRVQLKQGVEEYQKRKQIYYRESNPEKSHDNSDFFQAIVDNDIFRPLGWKPPKEEPEYTLISTSIDSIGTNSEAFIMERRSNQYYVVSVGDEISDAVVKKIEDRKITLYKNGELITFKTGNIEFLKTGDSRSDADSFSQYERDNGTERNNQRRTRSKSTDIEAKKRIAKMMKENNKQIKNLMKEVSKVEKNSAKTEQKILIEKKKTIATDLKLKTSSKK